jgi:hypothetical protein
MRYVNPQVVSAQIPTALIVALTLGLPGSGEAQSAEDIFMTALDRYEQRMEGIDSYTIVQETMGFESTVRLERSEMDGRSVFLPAGSAERGAGIADFHRLYPQLIERASVEGKESVDGSDCHVVAIEDFEGIDMGQDMNMGEGSFEPKRGVFYIDDDEYVIRKMTMDGEMESNGELQPFSMTSLISDYREVEGMLHPFLITVSLQGSVPGMSEEEIADLHRQMEEMEKQLAEMPEGQRAMVERMMKPQMERLEQMMGGGGMEVTIRTLEVRVNQ